MASPPRAGGTSFSTAGGSPSPAGKRRKLGKELAYSSLYDLLRPEEKDSYALGYDTNVPPPLYQAHAPGVPDLSRPVVHTDRVTSNKLLAAVRRTFPVTPFDEEVESDLKPPFRTAFSKPLSTTSNTTLLQSTPLPGVAKKPSTKRDEMIETTQVEQDGLEGEQDGVEEEPDVLPYVAFGPYPSTMDGKLKFRAKTNSPKRYGIPEKRTVLKRVQSNKTGSPPPEPMYKKMAKRWENLEKEVFSRETEYREQKKKDQERRLKNRQMRLSTEKAELAARKAMKSLEHEGRVEIEVLAQEAERIVAEIEKHREMLRVQTLREAAEQRRHERALAAQADRARQVRERAEQIVDAERVRLEREEQLARAKLRAMEVDSLHKARRREAMRTQMEQDAAEDARNQAALKALEQKLVKEPPTIPQGRKLSVGGLRRRSDVVQQHQQRDTPDDENLQKERVAAPESGSSQAETQKNETPKGTKIEKDREDASANAEGGGATRNDRPRRVSIQPSPSESPGPRETTLLAPVGKSMSEEVVWSDGQKKRGSKDFSLMESPQGLRPPLSSPGTHRDSLAAPSTTGKRGSTVSVADSQITSDQSSPSHHNAATLQTPMDHPSEFGGGSTPTGSYISAASPSQGGGRRSSQGLGVDPQTSYFVNIETRKSQLLETDATHFPLDKCSLSISRKETGYHSFLETLQGGVGPAGLSDFASLEVVTHLQKSDRLARQKSCLLSCLESSVSDGQGALPHLMLVSRFVRPPTDIERLPQEGTYVSSASVRIKEGWRPSDTLSYGRGGKTDAQRPDSSSSSNQTSAAGLKSPSSSSEDRRGSRSEPPLLSLELPRLCSVSEVVLLLQQVQLRCQLQDVGPRSLELRLAIAGIGLVKKVVQVRLVAPLLKISDRAALKKAVKDVSFVSPFESVAVNKNPHVSLASCTLTLSTNSEHLEDWFVESESLKGRMGPLGSGPGAEIGGNILLNSSNNDANQENNMKDHQEEGGAVVVGVARQDSKDHRKVSISFKESCTPALVESVIRSIHRSVSTAMSAQFTIELRTKGSSALRTDCTLTFTAAFSKPPLIPALKNTTRPYRPGTMEHLSVLSPLDLKEVGSGSSSGGLLLGSRLQIELSRHDKQRDRIFIQTGKGAMFSIQGEYLYSTVRRIRVGKIQRLSSATMEGQQQQHSHQQQAMMIVSVELIANIDVFELQTILSRIAFSSEEGTGLGYRQIKIRLSSREVDPISAVESKGDDDRKYINSDVVRSLRVLVGAPFLKRTSQTQPQHIQVKTSLPVALPLAGKVSHNSRETPGSLTWLDLSEELLKEEGGSRSSSTLPLAQFNLKFETSKPEICLFSMTAHLSKKVDMCGTRVQSSSNGSVLTLESPSLPTSAVRHLEDCLQGVRLTLSDPDQTVVVTVSLTDVVSNCTTRVYREVFGFISTPSPTVLLEHKELNYRQGSKPAQRGFELFPRARCLLPETRSFPTCEILVELVGGGMGDGEDVVEWLSAEKIQDRYERQSSFSVASDLANPCARNNELDELDSRVRCEAGEIWIGSVQYGTYESLGKDSGMRVFLSVLPDNMVAPSPSHHRQSAAPAGLPSPANPSSLSLKQEEISAVLKALTFRNSDPRLKSGARLFSAKVQWGKDDAIRLRVSVNAAPTLFAVPTFGSKVVAASHSLLPAICPKMVVNMDESSSIEPVLIQAEIKEGAHWGSNEDKILVNPQVSEFEIAPVVAAAASPPSDNSSNTLIGGSSSSPSSFGGRFTISHQGVLLGTMVHSEGSLSILMAKGIKLTGKVLNSLLRSIAYENFGHTTNAEPRIIEYCVEESNGDECLATVTVVVHAKEQPADVDLHLTRMDYVMNSQSSIIAPKATIIKSSVWDTTPILRVEFLQQHLPADTFTLESNSKTGITVVASSGTIYMKSESEEPIGTFSKKGNYLTVHFSNASLSACSAVMQSVGFKHAGSRDRQNQKKVQFSFTPKGQLWTRIAVPVTMHERCLDLGRIPAPQFQFLSVGESSSCHLFPREDGSATSGGATTAKSGATALLQAQSSTPAAYNGAVVSLTFGHAEGDNESKKPSGVATHEKIPPYELSYSAFRFRTSIPTLKEALEVNSTPAEGKAIPPTFQLTMNPTATRENLEAALQTIQLQALHKEVRQVGGGKSSEEEEEECIRTLVGNKTRRLPVSVAVALSNGATTEGTIHVYLQPLREN